MGRKPPSGTWTRTCLARDDNRYPPALRERLGVDAPAQLTVLGNPDLLTLPKTALFCSARCPGDAILAAHDQAVAWREAGHCVISGFHSPVEKECLRILWRGRQPIIICLARGLEGMRIPALWKEPLAAGRLHVVSCFSAKDRRVTTALAEHRNLLVAALADNIIFVYTAPGGHMEQLANQVAAWRQSH